ncbi:MAG: hypothetical protein KIT27_05345 [Legionellales bacterium]|nr:hypothetical protein [Legionellales bacterium]
MLFVIRAFDKTDGYKIRPQVRPEHIARVELLKNQQRLVLAGPLLNAEETPIGSLIIAEFNSIEEATTWAYADPYQTAGIFAQIEINYFKQVF